MRITQDLGKVVPFNRSVFCYRDANTEIWNKKKQNNFKIGNFITFIAFSRLLSSIMTKNINSLFGRSSATCVPIAIVCRPKGYNRYMKGFKMGRKCHCFMALQV